MHLHISSSLYLPSITSLYLSEPPFPKNCQKRPSPSQINAFNHSHDRSLHPKPSLLPPKPVTSLWTRHENNNKRETMVLHQKWKVQRILKKSKKERLSRHQIAGIPTSFQNSNEQQNDYPFFSSKSTQMFQTVCRAACKGATRAVAVKSVPIVNCTLSFLFPPTDDL